MLEAQRDELAEIRRRPPVQLAVVPAGQTELKSPRYGSRPCASTWASASHQIDHGCGGRPTLRAVVEHDRRESVGVRMLHVGVSRRFGATAGTNGTSRSKGVGLLEGRNERACQAPATRDISTCLRANGGLSTAPIPLDKSFAQTPPVRPEPPVLPVLTSGPPLLHYPSIFRSSRFGTSAPYLHDLASLVQTIGASEFRPSERCKARVPFPIDRPGFPEVRTDILAAIARAQVATRPTAPSSAPIKLTLQDWLVFWTLEDKRQAHARRHDADHNELKRRLSAFDTDREIAEKWLPRVLDFEQTRKRVIQAWQSAVQDWESQRQRSLEEWNRLKKSYASRSTAGVVAYLQAGLTTVPAPTWCPHNFTVHYDSSNRIAVLDYQLPHFGDFQVLKTRALKRETKSVPATRKESAEFCDKISYLLVLRMLREIAEFDERLAVRMACVNGYVVRNDPATGRLRSDVVLSVAVLTADILHIQLDRVDPESCFRSLKGLAAAALGDLVPVAPIIQFDRHDPRFVEGKAILDHAVGQNLATMDWQDFEHLIRELFEKEFASDGVTVHITQASRCGFRKICFGSFRKICGSQKGA
jgi:hypothetical protein